MTPGDLVQIITVNEQREELTLGFITKIQDRHLNGTMFCFVRSTLNGKGFWYHPSKLKVISEIR